MIGLPLHVPPTLSTPLVRVKGAALLQVPPRLRVPPAIAIAAVLLLLQVPPRLSVPAMALRVPALLQLFPTVRVPPLAFKVPVALLLQFAPATVNVPPSACKVPLFTSPSAASPRLTLLAPDLIVIPAPIVSDAPVVGLMNTVGAQFGQPQSAVTMLPVPANVCTPVPLKLRFVVSQL